MICFLALEYNLHKAWKIKPSRFLIYLPSINFMCQQAFPSFVLRHNSETKLIYFLLASLTLSFSKMMNIFRPSEIRGEKITLCLIFFVGLNLFVLWEILLRLWCSKYFSNLSLTMWSLGTIHLFLSWNSKYIVSVFPHISAYKPVNSSLSWSTLILCQRQSTVANINSLIMSSHIF